MDKLFWKTIYYWIRYFHYEIINIENNEIWASNYKDQSIVIFRKDISTSQEIKFDISRFKDNLHLIEKEVNFKLKTVKYLYFTENVIDITEFKEYDPIKISVNLINKSDDLNTLFQNRMINYLFQTKSNKSQSYYKRRVLNNHNQLEKYMAQFTPMTYLLISINVLIWLVMILITNHFSNIKLLDVGGLVHFNVVHGEWYRLITSLFLHFNFEHILMNMLSLFIFGKIVEAIVGPIKMLAIYLISGLFGNFVSLSFNTDTVSVGASGAIFGLIGSIITMMFVSRNYSRKTIGQLLIVLVILTGLSLMMSNVNIMAHLGGLLGGILITLIGYYYQVNRNVFWITLVIFLLLFIVLQIRIFTIKEDNIYNILIEEEMKKNDYTEASHIVNKTINNHYDDDRTFYLTGLITAATKSKAESIDEWERGLKLYPNSPLLNYELAIANRSLSDNDKAEKYINKALKIEPKNKNYLNLKKELEKVNES